MPLPPDGRDDEPARRGEEGIAPERPEDRETGRPGEPRLTISSIPLGAAGGAVRLTAACCAPPTRFRVRCGRAGGPRELLASLVKHARGPDPRPFLANSSRSPAVLGGGSRDAPPLPRPASFESRRRGSPEEGVWSTFYTLRTVTARRDVPRNSSSTSVIVENQDLTPCLGREGCPASAVRARAGPRTVPRAGRRIRRARACNERSEAFAIAPAARAAGPMRVAGANEAMHDTGARIEGGGPGGRAKLRPPGERRRGTPLLSAIREAR